jgi:hypothetical protein
MSIFSKTTNVYGETYYIIDSNLYKFECKFPDKDGTLPVVELLNKYGFRVSKYNLEFGEFEEWASTYCCNLDALPYDMTKAKEVTKMTLDKAISTVKKEFEKKFKDFPLDGTLYTSTLNPYYYDGVCFQPIVKPLRKLVNESEDNIARRLILEVEMLDGKSSETRCEFIPFGRFVDYYAPGCAIKVIESNHPNDSYCDYRDVGIDDYFNL